MFAGILNEVIEIWRFTKSRNSFGEEVMEKQFHVKTRAGVSHASTRRTVVNDEIQYPYQKFFIVRIYVDVQEDDWIKYKGKFYRILSIEDNDKLQNKKIDVEIVNETV